ncbi:MAG TPA: ABC transporter ATP-binding protein [Spirochaetaceae bacterium]|jgi:putative ABC transport system ATP-binding protein|nr:ABC transporter ATP-binding protein [Spirochaetaceae bacterium]
MIALESLSVLFNPGTPDERAAIKDLSISVPRGQWVSLIGSNGAGKTTLFNAIAGSVSPAAGRVIIDGLDRSRDAEYLRARFVGRVRQDPGGGTAPDMTVMDNLALASRKGARRLLPAKPRALKLLLKERLAELGMGLEERCDENVSRLSGGQRQALALLMAAFTKPAVLLLDEHTAALDPRNADIVMELTRRFVRGYGLTAMMVTHDMRRAAAEGDRLIMMHEGQIVADLSGQEKKGLSVEGLVRLFKEVRGHEYAEDRDLLS